MTNSENGGGTAADSPPPDPLPAVASEDNSMENQEFPVEKPVSTSPGSLMSLEDAVSRLPDSLKSEMKELLRADFREVRRLNKNRQG